MRGKKGMLFLLIMIALLVLLCVSASAESPEKHKCGDYEYILQEDGTAEIYYFYNREKEMIITVPSMLDGIKVTSIGEQAFYHKDMSEIIIPEGIVSIRKRAFDYCENLTAVTIPDSISFIESNPFSSCKQLKTINISADHPYLELIDGSLICRDDNRLIFHICDYITFNGGGIVHNVYTVPDDVQIIGEYSFTYNTEKVQEIEIPESVTEIQDNAFYGSMIRKINLPSSLTRIGRQAFCECTSLMFITIPENVKEIGDYAFHHCESLTEINLPESIVSLGSNPFSRCINLYDIDVSPDHPYLASINGIIFSKPDKRLIIYPCSRTETEYSIPQGIRTIGGRALSFSEKLQNVSIPDSVTDIQEEAFWCCYGIKSFSIPDSVVSIGERAFYACRSIEEIVIPDSVTEMGTWVFGACDNLKKAKLSNNLTSIGEKMFNGLKLLKSIEIPDSVTFIGDRAFAGCENLVITVGHDSYAKEYCVEHDIKYEYPDALDWLND